MISGRRGRRRRRSRRSADSSPACGSGRRAHQRLLARLQRHPVVIDHDQRAIPLDHRPLARRSTAARSGYSRRRMYSQTSSSVQFDSGKTRMLSPGAMRVLYRLHSSGRWLLRIPAVRGARDARRCAPWRGDFSSSRRAPPIAASKPYWSSACRSACGLHHVGVQRRAVAERDRCPAPTPSSLTWTIRSSPRSRTRSIAKSDHLAKLPGRIDMQQRERRLGRDKMPSSPGAAAPTESLPIE